MKDKTRANHSPRDTRQRQRRARKTRRREPMLHIAWYHKSPGKGARFRGKGTAGKILRRGRRWVVRR